MKRKLHAGSTGRSVPIFVFDSTKTDGSGLALVYNTAGLVAEYRREGQASWAAFPLSAGTLGTYSSGGFVADGGVTGAYELGLPDAAIAAGSATWCLVRLRGAASMVAAMLEIELDAIDYQDAVRAGLTALPSSAAGSASGVLTGARVLGSPRALDSAADGTVTVDDALWCAVAGAAGKEAKAGTSYVVRTPSTGTVIRTFTLDSATAPTARN